MAKTAKNKKYVELTGVRIYHNKKDNTIQFISTDPDLVGKPFKINLSNGSPTENTLRELLIEKGVLNVEDSTPTNTIPKFVEYDTSKLLLNATPELNTWNKIPIGVTYNEELVTIDILDNPHTLISGHTGTGKTMVEKSFIKHALNYPDQWKIVGVDLKRIELSQLNKKPNPTPQISTTLEDVALTLQRVKKEMQERAARIQANNLDSYRQLTNSDGKPLPAIMVVIDEVSYITGAEGVKTAEGEKRDQLHKKLEDLLVTISQKGTNSGVNLVVCTQNPVRTILHPEIKNNMGNKIVTGNPGNSLSGFGLGKTLDKLLEENKITPQDIQVLKETKGRAIISNGTKIQPFQIFYLPHLD